MDTNVLSALKAIDVATLDRSEWLAVGMALKKEGFDCDTWDEWSQNDTRYHQGECKRLWNGFHGASNPVKAGTIIRLAKERGWNQFNDRDEGLDWNDVIEYDGDEAAAAPTRPTDELVTYLETLFDPDDRVNFVTDAFDDNGKWKPRGYGMSGYTAGKLIELLKRYPDDISATIGDYNHEAGAWIRFNPVDGDGIANKNITKYKYGLVESDTLPIDEQEALYRRLQLPIAVLVHSGKKSLHAIVRVDARDYDEYKQRMRFLYDYMKEHGASIDKQNSNPSRLSRMPGIERGSQRQRLIVTNIGRKSWLDWMDFVELGGTADELPEIESLEMYRDNRPELPEELIEGILRRGHKMLISGSSKAGKSFLLMELCIAIAEGREWLGFKCKQGRVLYVNLEIDPASAINRFFNIYEASGTPMEHMDSIAVWNLRGRALPLDQLVPKLVRRVENRDLDAIVIDPIYKVITGDENNASEMGHFCNQFDKICNETGCSVIYCHHHSKGAQGAKKAIDRASGSGVFARDPDAQLDMIQLELSDDIRNNVADGGETAWRLESSLREFPNIRPVNFWFEYPVHRLDESGILSRVFPEGSSMNNLAKSKNFTTPEERKADIDKAYDACNTGDHPISVRELADYLELSERCVRSRLKEFSDEYWIRNGIVGKKTEQK